ncbi:uncharacterized protein LOC117300764 [Asterias rubens]|uniref:uncharacterized protein LOC117300764 n=1 Tax=Asterias rubens TaxID=7604 RepID=UPI001455B294|nr:uncharacterized protein LOC117300764 [Asterias rubens]
MQPAQQQPPAYQHGTPQQQTTTVQQHPVVTLQPATSAGVPGGNKRGNWCWRGLRVTGYMQTILGVLAVAFGTAAILMKSYLHLYGIPVGSGICFTLAGILGIAAAGKRSIGLVLGYMVMSVCSALATLGVGGIAGIAASVDRRSCPSYPYPGAQFYSHSCVTSTSARFGVDVCIVLIAIAELVISIAGASLSCCGLSYTSYNPDTLPQPMVTYQTYPQQMVAGAPPQGVYINSGASVTYPNQIAVQPAQTYQPQGQFQPPPQGQFQPPPEGQMQPPPQQHPEAPLDPSKDENHYQPLTK